MLIIFDKDSTIVKPVGPNNNLPASKASDQVLYDDVKAKCDQLRKDGNILAVASNQGGVAFGLVSREDALAMMKDASDKIGASLFALCVCHPQGEKLGMVRNSIYRKPGPGMIQYLMDALGFAPQDTTFVGDLDSDRLAAEAAHVSFVWADEFFGRGKATTEQANVDIDDEPDEDDEDSEEVVVVDSPFPIDEDDIDDDDEDEDVDDDDEDEDYWAQWEDDGGDGNGEDSDDSDDSDDDTDGDDSEDGEDGDDDIDTGDSGDGVESGGGSDSAPASDAGSSAPAE